MPFSIQELEVAMPRQHCWIKYPSGLVLEKSDALKGCSDLLQEKLSFLQSPYEQQMGAWS